MTFLVPLMLFGWVPLTVVLFFRIQPHRAVLFSVIGGWLFLPMAGYSIQGLPEFSKSEAIAYGLVLGGWLAGKRQQSTFKWHLYDLPMILWCLCPVPSSVSNQLGWYNGFSGVFSQTITWGVPYFAGRIYFDTPGKIKDLCLGIVTGGLLYVPLCLYEFRMSPRLSINFYGFFPHDWRQHSRFDWWRPIVFMQHGLMVSLWMAAAATTAFWLWRGRVVSHIMGIPMYINVTAMVFAAVLCLSGNGWFTLGLGCASYTIYIRVGTARPFLLLLLAMPTYIFLRIKGIITAYDVEVAAGLLFDAERVGSLGIRLFQEDLFVQAVKNLLFGAGKASLAWPVDPVTGEVSIKMIDSLWLIAFSFRGVFGLITFLLSMLIGPWLVFRSAKKNTHSSDELPLLTILLGLIVLLFMIDSLVNAMINPVYILCAGVLLSKSAEGDRAVMAPTIRC